MIIYNIDILQVGQLILELTIVIAFIIGLCVALK